MIKLYGIGLSNYYNMVKLSLTEKGLDFEEVMAEPSQESDYTSKSPMGRSASAHSPGPASDTARRH